MNKVTFPIAVLLMMLAILPGCQSPGPKATAEKFLNGFYHMDYASAKQVSDSLTQRQLDAWENAVGTMVNKDAKAEAAKTKVMVMEPKIMGDKAVVSYSTDREPAPRTLNLVKQKGKWLVQWGKREEMMARMGTGATFDAPPVGPDNDRTNGSPVTQPDTQMAPPADVPPPGMPSGDTARRR